MSGELKASAGLGLFTSAAGVPACGSYLGSGRKGPSRGAHTTTVHSAHSGQFQQRRKHVVPLLCRPGFVGIRNAQFENTQYVS